MKNRKKTEKKFEFFFGVEKSKIANRPKRVLPKFRADSSHVRIENGRSKFALAGFAKHKQFVEGVIWWQIAWH